ncbi:MAG: hypothetical protein CBC13_06345 [Planctomycetia bacterium TMED53]|nr:MAG: hypothetical protein CBC13_06345 [Planctomycetia bacterium TMED53]
MRGDRHLLTYFIGCLFLALIGLLIFQSSGYSQTSGYSTAPPLIVADTSRDHLIGLKDLDGDGFYFSPEEHSILLTELSGIDLSIPAALLSRPDDLLLLDGGSVDQLISLRDLDGDGSWIGNGETSVLYDGGNSIPDWVYPTALCRDPASVQGVETLYVADRSTTRRRILQLRDLDGDGSFSTGEAQIWWSVLNGPNIDPSFLPTELLAIAPSELLVVDGPRGLIHRAHDIDGNGIIDTDAEWSPWFVAPSDFGITRISDFQRGDDGRFWLTDDVSGQVFIFEDSDSSDRIDRNEEVILFTSKSSPRSIWPHPSTGAFIGDGETDTLWFCRDEDGDGSAFGNEECIALLPDSFADLSTPSAISGPQGWQSLQFESIDPPWVSREGQVVEIHGDGWSTGVPISLQVSGTEIPATSVLPQRIVADFPPLQEGVHDLWIQSGQWHGYIPAAITVVPTFIRGDVTRDQHINLADPLRLLQWLYIPGVPPLPCLDAADVNDDELLQLTDAVWLLDYLFGGGPMPQLPFPESGPDPVQEEQGCVE